MPAPYRVICHNYTGKSSSRSSHRDRSPSVESCISDTSDTLSDVSTLSSSSQSTLDSDRSSITVASPNDSFQFTEVSREEQQSLENQGFSNEVNPHTAYPDPTSGPWANTFEFDVEGYLAGFAPQKALDPRQTYGKFSRCVIFGNRDADGYIVAEPLIYCLRGTSNLFSPEMPALYGEFPKKFIFEINWPGYPICREDLLKNFAEEFKNETQLTRRILAHLIAKMYMSFISYYGLRVNERVYGEPPIQLRDESVMIGPGGIDYYRMNIAYIIEGRGGIWTAFNGIMASYPK